MFFKAFKNGLLDDCIVELISESDTNIGTATYNYRDGKLYYSYIQMKNYTISQIMMSTSLNTEIKIWRVIALY